MDIKFLEKLNIECDSWKDILQVNAEVYMYENEHSLCVTFGILRGGRVAQTFTMTFTPRTARDSEMRIPKLPESFEEEFGLETTEKIQQAMDHVKTAILNKFFPKMKVSSTRH